MNAYRRAESRRMRAENRRTWAALFFFGVVVGLILWFQLFAAEPVPVEPAAPLELRRIADALERMAACHCAEKTEKSQ
jgi:hypothetical protein